MWRFRKCTVVPDGYGYIDFSASNLGVCWMQGTEPEFYCKEDDCAKKLSEEGLEIVADKIGAWWFFERYGYPRFIKPDKSG